MYTTDRLLLRAFEERDKPDILALYNDPAVIRWITKDYLNPRDLQYFETSIRPFIGRCFVYAVITTREFQDATSIQHPTFVGQVFLLHSMDTTKNRDVTLGIALRTTCQGKGYGTEILRFMIGHAFSALGMHRLSLSVFEGNKKAHQLYKTLGFVDEGRLREANRTPEGSWEDLIYMSMLEKEWRRDEGTLGDDSSIVIRMAS
ncbi:acyl-CoA N-acyltransferase [Schizophyllum amplum]|uniref:Acyl-CoA N-acyltransferase n=1 Tax=Schizophyllum amplum TaxID=97359 RepID=A0A550CDD0_9AGAR|nr:acyl-CoA N-acyltransferase [Auriculariopsis ampla]